MSSRDLLLESITAPLSTFTAHCPRFPFPAPYWTVAASTAAHSLLQQSTITWRRLFKLLLSVNYDDTFLTNYFYHKSIQPLFVVDIVTIAKQITISSSLQCFIQCYLFIMARPIVHSLYQLRRLYQLSRSRSMAFLWKKFSPI